MHRAANPNPILERSKYRILGPFPSAVVRSLKQRWLRVRFVPNAFHIPGTDRFSYRLGAHARVEFPFRNQYISVAGTYPFPVRLL